MPFVEYRSGTGRPPREPAASARSGDCAPEERHPLDADVDTPEPPVHGGSCRDRGDLTEVRDQQRSGVKDAVERDASGLEEIDGSAIGRDDVDPTRHEG